MKHLLLATTIILSSIIGNAQLLNYGDFYSRLGYDNSALGQPGFFIRDSLVYQIRSKGLEILNTQTGEIDYEWRGRYPLTAIAPDSGGRYVFLKGTEFIGRYDSASQQYKNIGDAVFVALYNVAGIGVSPNYNVWTAGQKKVGIFDGNSWQWHMFNNVLGFNNLLVVNDSTAYLYDKNDHVMYRYQNGSLVTVQQFAANLQWYSWAAVNYDDLWLATTDSLLLIHGNALTSFNSTNCPAARSRSIAILPNGHLVASIGNHLVYEYDGAVWNTLPALSGNVKYLAVDNSGQVNAVFSSGYYAPFYDSLAVFTGPGWQNYGFSFYPYKNMRAICAGYYNIARIATDDGIFIAYTGPQSTTTLVPTQFIDDTVTYSSDVTCFANDGTTYGTHHGVFGVTIDNTLLPDTNINCILYDNGSYYIGTNKGLCVYNQVVYTSFDTSNSGIPSQRVTCIVLDDQHRMYVGTDKGMAIYTAGHWQVFDTSNVAISSFNVTGIQLPVNYPDTSIWISTMGSGLLMLNYNGTYRVLNTQNNQFEDDSLYYVATLELGKCGRYRIIGTKHNGLASKSDWNQNFVYDRGGSYPIYDTIIESPLFSSNSTSYWSYIVTNSGIAVETGCASVPQLSQDNNKLLWYIEGQQLVVTVPDDFDRNGNLLLTDILGNTISNTRENVQTGSTIRLAIGNLPASVYILQLTSSDKRATAKVVIR